MSEPEPVDDGVCVHCGKGFVKTKPDQDQCYRLVCQYKQDWAAEKVAREKKAAQDLVDEKAAEKAEREASELAQAEGEKRRAREAVEREAMELERSLNPEPEPEPDPDPGPDDGYYSGPVRVCPTCDRQFIPWSNLQKFCHEGCRPSMKVVRGSP